MVTARVTRVDAPRITVGDVWEVPELIEVGKKNMLFRSTRTNLFAVAILAVAAIVILDVDTSADDDALSIAEKTRVHRLSTTNRAPYDAFAYVNRIPTEPSDGEQPIDYFGRIFGRLANQEGRILLKVPAGMDRETYEAFKVFFRYESDGTGKVGNCAVCHTPSEFTDFQEHIVTAGGQPKPTPSLRNLSGRNVDLRQAILDKIKAAQSKQSGQADKIDDAYAKIDITMDEVPGLVKFLKLLDDVSDTQFRQLILDATILNTFESFE